MTYRVLTQAELTTEAKARFGDDVMSWGFACPNCGDVATFGDFKQAAAELGKCGQECIGRSLGSMNRPRNKKGHFADRGCDWAAYGLFRGPWEIIMPEGDGLPQRSAWSFPLAGKPAIPPPATEFAVVTEPGKIRIVGGGRLIAKALLGNTPGSEAGWDGWRLYLVVRLRGAAFEALRVLAPGSRFKAKGSPVHVYDGDRLAATARQSAHDSDWTGWLVTAGYATEPEAVEALKALAANPIVARAVNP